MIQRASSGSLCLQVVGTEDSLCAGLYKYQVELWDYRRRFRTDFTQELIIQQHGRPSKHLVHVCIPYITSQHTCCLVQKKHFLNSFIFNVILIFILHVHASTQRHIFSIFYDFLIRHLIIYFKLKRFDFIYSKNPNTLDMRLSLPKELSNQLATIPDKIYFYIVT